MRWLTILTVLTACERSEPNDPVPPALEPSFQSERRLVPSGWFWAGCTRVHAELDEAARIECVTTNPPRHLHLIEFMIDREPVKVGEYTKCAEARHCTRLKDPARPEELATVTSLEASQYCKWRGAELPSEAQWEKAARGMEVSPTYPWGVRVPHCMWSDSSNDRLCNSGPTSVRNIDAASPYDVRNLHGRHREWVSDDFGPIAHELRPVWRRVTHHRIVMYALDLPRTLVRWNVTERSNPAGQGTWHAHVVKGGPGYLADRMPGDRKARHAFRCVTGESAVTSPRIPPYPIAVLAPYPHDEDSPQPEPGLAE